MPTRTNDLQPEEEPVEAQFRAENGATTALAELTNGGHVTPAAEAIAALDLRATAMQRIVQIGLSGCARNAESCFTRYGTKYRLTAAGVSRFLQPFGAEVSPPQYDETACGHYRTQGGVDHFQWTSLVRLTIPGVGSATALGWWGTERPGYIGQRYDAKADTWAPITKSMEADVKKSATTQALVNAVQRLLGVEALNERELTDAGVDVSVIKSVEFKGGGNGGLKSDPPSEELQAQVRDILSTVGVESQADCDRVVIVLSGFTGDKGKVPGKPMAQLSEKWLGSTKAKIAKVVEAMKRDGADGTDQAVRYAEALVAKGGK